MELFQTHESRFLEAQQGFEILKGHDQAADGQITEQCGKDHRGKQHQMKLPGTVKALFSFLWLIVFHKRSPLFQKKMPYFTGIIGRSGISVKYGNFPKTHLFLFLALIPLIYFCRNFIAALSFPLLNKGIKVIYGRLAHDNS